MTLATLAASGRGVVAYALEVPGLGVFTTRKDWSPYTSDYGTRHYPWLIHETLPEIREQVDPLEGSLDVDDLTVEIADVGGAMTALVRDWRASGYAYLTATLTAAATTADVDDTSWCGASGTVWCERESMRYSGISSLQITGLTRGTLQTDAADHTVDYAVDPPRRPLVTDAPHTLIGRRAILRCAHVDDAGTIGEPEIVYRGRIVGYRAGHGLWRLELAHVSSVLLAETCHGMPSCEVLPGYYYAGTDPRSVPAVLGMLDGVVDEIVSGALTRGWYAGPAALARAWGVPVRAASLTLEPQLLLDGDRWQLYCDTTSASRHIVVAVRYGDPLWALGFDPGQYVGEDGAAFEATAQNAPRALVVDFDVDDAGYPEIRTQSQDVIVPGCYVVAPEQPYAYVVGTTHVARGPGVPFDGTIVYLDRRPDIALARDGLWVIEDDDDLTIQHVVVLGSERSDCTLAQAIQTLLGLGSGDEPAAWFPAHVDSSDFEFGELTAIAVSLPSVLSQMRRMVITEPAKLWDLIGPHLGLLGIFPRLTATGKIGFARLSTPTALTVDAVALDSAIWALHGAVDVETRADGAALINEIVVEHDYDYRDESYSDARTRITWDDGVSLLGATRSVEYPLRGLSLNSWGMPVTEAELANAIKSQVNVTHFGSYGRASSALEIPCTWTARQILVGDYVAVTHDLATDVVRGTHGVTARYALVIGRTRSLTGADYDALIVQLYPGAAGVGIAPCVRCAVYHLTTAQLVASSLSTYAPDGAADTDWLSSSHLPCNALATTRWATTMATWAVVVTAVSGSYLYLQSDAFSSAFPSLGVYVTLADYDDAVAWQRQYAYHASEAMVPVLGDNSDDAQEWSI